MKKVVGNIQQYNQYIKITLNNLYHMKLDILKFKDILYKLKIMKIFLKKLLKILFNQYLKQVMNAETINNYLINL